MIALVRQFDRWTRTRPWWWWPASLLFLGLAAWSAALILHPQGEQTFLGANRFGEDCAFLTLTGKPCPNCGMTRSFLWSARFSVGRAFAYSPAGAVLFWWITGGAVVGGLRLIRRDPKALRPPWQFLVGLAFTWVIALYATGYGLRLAGWNPLPR